MNEVTTAFVGLDVHKESIAIAVAEPGRAAPRFLGTTRPSLVEIEKALRHLGASAEVQIRDVTMQCGNQPANIRMIHRRP